MSQAEWLEGNSLWNRTGHPRAWGLELTEKGLLVKRCQESRPITSEQTGTPWEPISPQQKSRGESSEGSWRPLRCSIRNNFFPILSASNQLGATFSPRPNTPH